MRYCTNPACYQGDPGNPPEFASNNSDRCVLCDEEIDLDDDEYTEIDAGKVCEDCAKDQLKTCLQCEYKFYPLESKALKKDEFCSLECDCEFNEENQDVE